MKVRFGVTEMSLSRIKSIPIIVFGLICMADAEPEKLAVERVSYRILRAPAKSVRIFWKDRQGQQLRTFPEVARHFESNGVVVKALMNGGIFEPGGVPSGLLIQDGRELMPLNTMNGDGNFYLKPNGIFLIGTGGAAVIRTDEFPLKDIKVEQAVQSGPLLLRNGKIHPAFNANSTSRLHRNGVGVSKKGEVVFAITDFNSLEFPNLHEFAKLFRSLGCDDALFLDGDLSQMRFAQDIHRESNQFGSFIAVTEIEQAGQRAKAKPATGPVSP